MSEIKSFESAIYVKNLNSNEVLFDKNSEVVMQAASVIKVPIMLYVLQQVKQGKVKLEDELYVSSIQTLSDTEVFESGANNYSIEELLYWMIINSDNTATNVLIDEFGLANINRYIVTDLKVNNVKLQRKMLDFASMNKGVDNYMNAKDMCKIFEKIFRREILNDNLCYKAQEILLAQRDKQLALRYIYKPVVYYHKTGELSSVRHDVGVMVIDKVPYYVGISIFNMNKNLKGDVIIGELGKTIYQQLSK